MNNGEMVVPPISRATVPRFVRRVGIALLPFVVGEGALGVASVGQGTSGGSPLLFVHIGLGTGLAVTAGWLLTLALRPGKPRVRWATGFTSGSLLSTAITGAIFLVTGFGQGLLVDRALGLASIAGTILMIVSGSGDPPANQTAARA